MDRVASIDMYMRAGPFSDVAIIKLLNEHFVPLNAVPKPPEQQKFELLPYRFVEPGFLVIAPDETVVQRTDRMTTLHMEWLRRIIANAVQVPMSELVDAETPLLTQMQKAQTLFRTGDHAAAERLFRKLAAENPDHPLGHKAAAEGQGIGPFVRGFEVDCSLPDAVFKMTDSSAVTNSNVYSSEDLWQRGTDYLLSMQDISGGFFDSDYDFGGADSLPNVHVAVTAICGMAMLERWQFETDPKKKQRLADAVMRAANFVADDAHINLHDQDERFWALAYRLEFWGKLSIQGQGISRWDDRLPLPVVKRCIRALESIQLKNGTWAHEYSNPFVTATGVLALKGALSLRDPDSRAFERGVAALSRLRFGNGVFPYDSQSADKVAQPLESAAGRMPLCEVALFAGGESLIENVQAAIETSFRFQRDMEAAYKYDDHTNHYAYGGFFFWYDMRGRRQAIDMLPYSDFRTAAIKQLRAIVLSKPEIDGCFVGSHELGRCYGTAMALLTLGNDVGLSK